MAAPIKWSRGTLIEAVRSECLVDVVTGCWVWKNGKDKDGYAKFYFEGKHWRVARAVLHVLTGDLQPHTRHTCDNPPCCNPDHLLWGTARDNVLDAVSRGRFSFNSRPQHGEQNGRSKLTDEQRAEIVRRRLSGERASDLAREFGVGRARVHALCPGLKPGPGPVQAWSRLPEVP